MNETGKPAPEIWRIGSKIPLNVYKGNRPVCQCHSVADAAAIVCAMNENAELKAFRSACQNPKGSGGMQCCDPIIDGEIAALRAENADLRFLLNMGDRLNNLDVVSAEDEEFTRPAFESVRAALASEQPEGKPAIAADGREKLDTKS